MVCTKSVAVALVAVLLACTGTRTGNPNETGRDGPEPPDGVDLVRSSLARERRPQVTSGDRMQLALDNQAFAFALFGEAAAEEGNFFFSPYSISLAMAMTFAGAEADTERQIADALHFGLPEPELHAAFNATDLDLASRSEPIEVEGEEHDGLRLSILNAAFTRKDLSLEEVFLDVLALHYDAGMYTLDFGANAEGARANINDWAAEQTQGRIEQLLPEGAITERVALVLTNAVHFEANWAIPFDPAETVDGVFHTPAADVQVAMMHQTIQGQYAAGDGYQALALEYVPTSVKMLVILPEAGRLAEIEAALDAEFLADVRARLSTHLLIMTVPRFSYASQLELKAALSALGMPDAFMESVADFSGVTTELPLHISDVYHQSFIAVDEHGTEAAAASAAVLPGRGVPPRADVVLDRPFVFLIYDEPTEQILFLGRVADPS